MYELLPFWHTFFTRLGFEVHGQPLLQPQAVPEGQRYHPQRHRLLPRQADATAISGGLCEQGVDAMFYPCMSYNLDEDLGDNHYNCPVVAYYPEVHGGQLPRADQDPAYLRLLSACSAARTFTARFAQALDKYFPGTEPRGCAGRHRCRL